MKTIETIATKCPNVGLVLTEQGQSLRGQLGSIGFICHEAATAEGLDWVVVDSTAKDNDLATRFPGLPILAVAPKISMYVLKQAIVRAFNPT